VSSESAVDAKAGISVKNSSIATYSVQGHTDVSAPAQLKGAKMTSRLDLLGLLPVIAAALKRSLRWSMSGALSPSRSSA
jgi:hypothetical protein